MVNIYIFLQKVHKNSSYDEEENCTIIYGYFDFIHCGEKYGTKFFYKSSHRRVTYATTMLEVRNLVETIKRQRSVVLLPPAGGDECDQASDNEEVP